MAEGSPVQAEAGAGRCQWRRTTALALQAGAESMPVGTIASRNQCMETPDVRMLGDCCRETLRLAHTSVSPGRKPPASTWPCRVAWVWQCNPHLPSRGAV